MAVAVLYSYRRCPYAMRARMAIRSAQIEVEIREISLRQKPAHMLQVSPKGTVPVLVLPNGCAIDESLDIARWALSQHDPDHWLASMTMGADALIAENDNSFKRALDRYKYADRYPERPQVFYRQQGEQFLSKLEALLTQHGCLCGNSPSLADIAIFPFVRQFAAVEPAWFAVAGYPKLRQWLESWVNSDLFLGVMQNTETWVA